MKKESESMIIETNKDEIARPGVHKKVLSLIDKYNSQKKILDVACGRGIMCKRLNDRGHEAIGTDINNFSRYNINFVKADLNKSFPFKDSSFDSCVAIEIIEHLENPRHFMRELKRITRSGGDIFLTTPNIIHWKARLKFLLTGVHWSFRDIDYKITGHITPLKLADLQNICNELNLKITKVTYDDSENSLFGTIMILKIKKMEAENENKL